MKNLILFLSLFVFTNSFCQDYKLVGPTEYIHTDGKGVYEHNYVFKLTTCIEGLLTNNFCALNFDVIDNDGNTVPRNNFVRVLTGYGLNFVETETKCDAYGYCRFTIPTANLPVMAIVISFNGHNQFIKLRDVSFNYFNKEK